MKKLTQRLAFGLALASTLAVTSGIRADQNAGDRDEIPLDIHIDDVIDLELQQLYVTVTDRRHRRVLDLGRDEFAVFEENRPQEIVTFERGDVPFTAVLLLDGSLSMQGDRFAAALSGADRFIAGMRELDEARLMVFADELLAATLWGRDRAALRALLDDLEPQGGTAILDHLYMALMRLDERQGRRVVVLLSDGWDLHSVVTPEQVRRVARRSQALIFWVRLAGDASRAPWRFGEIQARDLHQVAAGSWRDLAGAREIFDELRHLVRESGGRAVEVTLGDLGSAFEDILAELREQYVLGFYPESGIPAEAYRSIRVDLKRRGLEVRACQGYQRKK